MQNIINKYRRYNWVATTFVVVLHVTETIPRQATHHKSFIYLLHLPVYWGGTIIWVMICLHLTYHIITCLFFHYSLNTSCCTLPQCFSPAWYSSSFVLNSSYGLNFVDSFSTPVIISIRAVWVFESVPWINQHS